MQTRIFEIKLEKVVEQVADIMVARRIIKTPDVRCHQAREKRYILR